MHSVLIVGAGGREHALAWACQRASGINRVVVTPGNPGMDRDGVETIPVDLADLEAVGRVADDAACSLIVIGPEAPLVGGLADRLRANGHRVLGPSAAAARLEGSKAYAKAVMAACGVPTARFATVSSRQALAAAIDRFQGTVALKADGLAQGKGVWIASDLQDARAAGWRWLRAFGSLVVEERLAGPEISVHALVSGDAVVPLPLARDYKRRFDGDLGPNTGGMGAVAPVASPISAGDLAEVAIAPVARHLAALGTPFQGVLYAGLMLTADGPRVLEYNVRFGDPETQALVGLLPADLPDWLMAAASGRLAGAGEMPKVAGHATAVVVVAGGYPEGRGRAKGILPMAEKSPGRVFWSGVAGRPEQLMAKGGRVATAVGCGPTAACARAEAYRLAQTVRFDGAAFRSDIGSEAGTD
ncbi:MAG: phosphoribosylamine--glycine ligase [Sulfobacillus sp.]